MPDPIVALIAGVVLVLVITVLIATIKSLIVIAPPNRAAVLTGRNRLLTDGQRVGYRSISGGRVFRVPIIETVQHMNLETIPIEVSVSNAFSKGNIPLNVEAIANVKIASEPEWVFNNAVERLLGKTEDEIKALAQDTLTGNLRGVLATLTPEAVNEDRLGFAKALSEDAGEDLASLGFHLDVLKIQNVSDERGYLAAIGREKSAEAIRQAEIAEARKRADTREAQAEASRRAEVREAAAAIKVAEAKNELRVRQAELDREGETAEKIARVKAQEAEVEAEKGARDEARGARGAASAGRRGRAGQGREDGGVRTGRGGGRADPGAREGPGRGAEAALRGGGGPGARPRSRCSSRRSCPSCWRPRWRR